MTPAYGGQPSDIGGLDCHPEIVKLAQRFLHVDGVPMDDGVQGQTESAKLFLLPLTERASDFAPLAMVNPAPELVPQFLTVQLNQDSPAERLVVDITQDVQRLDVGAKIGEVAIGRRTG